MDDRFQSRDRLGHVGKGQTPQGDVDGHSIFRCRGFLGGKSRGTGLGGIQTVKDEAQALAADTVQISRFLGHDSQPHAHGPLDRRETDEYALLS